jgi:hypothetical protein
MALILSDQETLKQQKELYGYEQITGYFTYLLVS